MQLFSLMLLKYHFTYPSLSVSSESLSTTWIRNSAASCICPGTYSDHPAIKYNKCNLQYCYWFKCNSHSIFFTITDDIHKDNGPMMFKNQPPIPLLPLKIMYKCLIDYLNKYELFYTHWYGFRQYHSTYMFLLFSSAT